MASRVDVIITFGYPAALVAKQKGTFPTVASGAGDPVSTGLVDGLARPGGNITGISDVSAELTPKRMELLKQMAPTLKRVAMLWNAADLGMTMRYRASEIGANALGISVQPLGVREPDDFEQAFSAMDREKPDAILMVTDSLTVLNRKRVFEYAAAHRLPAIYEFDFLVRDGGLMSYGPDFDENFARVAALVDRILKGTKPADLPFEQPTRFKFAINVKTAKALGLEVPDRIARYRRRGDRVSARMKRRSFLASLGGAVAWPVAGLSDRRVTVLCRAVAAVLLALAFLTLAHAQGSWPDRPIKFIVHVAAGGGVDMNARILVDRLNQQLPHPVLIENQGGGGGVIAGRMVANAAADGYTFLFAGPGHAAQAFMHKQPPFDPIRDFIPVSLVTEFPLVVVIKPSLPARTLAEFIALLKAEPDKHTFGSSGVGGSSHIPAEMFVRQAGVSKLFMCRSAATDPHPRRLLVARSI